LRAGRFGVWQSERHRQILGIVTLDGKPLGGAMVTFFPLADNGRSASGVSGSDGVFRLTTFTAGDGTLPGEYRVTVVKEPPPEVGGGPRIGESSEAFMKRVKPNFTKMAQKIEQTRQQAKRRPPLLPARYNHPTKSPLKATVPFQGELTIDLKSKGEN